MSVQGYVELVSNVIKEKEASSRRQWPARR